MNKIKIIYDVVKNMKDKDFIKGTLKAEGFKDDTKIFGIDNAFERNNREGAARGKASMEFGYDGRRMKLENSIDFHGEGCHGHRYFREHMHFFHHHHEEHMGDIKEGFDRVLAVLGILSSIKLDEKEDGSVILLLESAGIPEDIRKEIQERMKHAHQHHEHHMQHGNINGSHHQHMFMEEIRSMENPDFTLCVYVSKDRKVEKVTVDAKGEQKDEKNERHSMKLSAELCFE